MEHSIHLRAGSFIAGVGPMSNRTGHTAVNSSDDESDNGFDVADAVGKALGLVQQIRKSPQACAFLHRMCRETDIPELELVNFVRTRWASMFMFLERFLKLQKVGPILLTSDHY